MKLQNLFKFLIIALFLVPGLLTARSFDRRVERHFRGTPKTRVISYDLFNGFDNLSDTNRMDRVCAWLAKMEPDIVGLQELNGFTAKDLERMGKRWGHPYSAILQEVKGSPIGLTSRYPIEAVNRVKEGFSKGLLHVKTHTLDILVVHLDADSYEARRREADLILKYAEKIKGKRILLMGNFNALSPIDADYVERYATNLRLKNCRTPNLVGGIDFDYSVISKLLGFPFYDLCYRAVPQGERTTWPTKMVKGMPKSEYAQRKYASRMDFIFGNAGAKSISAEGFIVNGEDEAFLSHHYPVGVELVF